MKAQSIYSYFESEHDIYDAIFRWDTGSWPPSLGSTLWMAVVTGLTDQQISSDPGGDRWGRLLDRAVGMYLREVAPHLLDPTP